MWTVSGFSARGVQLPVGIALCAALAGCGSPAEPDLLVEPIQIDSVDVLVQESSPPTASARVRGVVGDGCSEIHSVRQERSDVTVTLAILRERPRNAVCTQIARLYDERIPLQGSFPPGDYVLRVNDFVRPFSTR